MATPETRVSPWPNRWRIDAVVASHPDFPNHKISSEALVFFTSAIPHIDRRLYTEGRRRGIVELVATPEQVGQQLDTIVSFATNLLDDPRSQIIIPLYGALPILTAITTSQNGRGRINWEDQVEPIRIRRSQGQTLVAATTDRTLKPIEPGQYTLIADDLVDGAGALATAVGQLTGETFPEHPVDYRSMIQTLEAHSIFLAVISNKNAPFWNTLEDHVKWQKTRWQHAQAILMEHVIHTDKWIMGAGPDTGIDGIELLHPPELRGFVHPILQELPALTLSIGRTCPGIIGMKQDKHALVSFVAEHIRYYLQR